MVSHPYALRLLSRTQCIVAVPDGPGGKLDAVARLCFFSQALQVVVDGVATVVKALGDLSISQALDNQR
jgi:hypothetical protein